MGFFSKLGEGLKKTRDALMGSVNGMLRSFTRIDDELFEELEEILVMGDVGTVTAGHLCEALRREVKAQGVTDPMAIRELLQAGAEEDVIKSIIRPEIEEGQVLQKKGMWLEMQQCSCP